MVHAINVGDYETAKDLHRELNSKINLVQRELKASEKTK
jgi:hypothetical protein